MKKVSAAFTTSFVGGLLLGGIPNVSAQTGTIIVPFEGVDYVVDRYDDLDEPSFEVTFNDFDFTSVYEFDLNGFVKILSADNERYRFLYRSNGNLRRVRLLSSRRQLGEEEEIEGDVPDMVQVDETDPAVMGVLGETTPAPGFRRRLFEDCGACLQTWDTVCDNGVATVCNLQDYGSPILSTGEVSIDVFCNDFGTLCNDLTADYVCQAECGGVIDECLAPLTITLEYEHTGESGSSSGESDGYLLDLYVIEPGGQTAYWNNGVTDKGFISSMDGSMTYTMFSGIDSVAAMGSYIAFVEWWQGPAPISWTVTATTGSGDVLFVEQGEFTGDDCGSTTSVLMFAELEDYVDNGCEDGGDGFDSFALNSHGAKRRA